MIVFMHNNEEWYKKVESDRGRIVLVERFCFSFTKLVSDDKKTCRNCYEQSV